MDTFRRARPGRRTESLGSRAGRPSSATGSHLCRRRPRDGGPCRKTTGGPAVPLAKAYAETGGGGHLSKGCAWSMFGVGLQEMIMIGLLFLVVFGPDKLTQTAREVGRFAREARLSVEEFKAELVSAEEPHGDGKPERSKRHPE
jgi:Sec-independent protein translocase protein TatA